MVVTEYVNVHDLRWTASVACIFLAILKPREKIQLSHVVGKRI